MSSTEPLPGVLRTPDDRFGSVASYPWPPSYVHVGSGLRMAYVDAGPPDAAETVLLLHGEPTWGYLYRHMIPPLLHAGFRVIVPDLIGFGRSDKPTDPTAYTYSAHVGWVSEFVELLDLQNATIFGQDWGGLIGGRVLADHLPRFARAVFSNTTLPGSGPAFPGLTAQQRLDPDVLRTLLGLDWRSTVDDDDRISSTRVHELIHQTPAPYFLAWRVYSQEVAEIIPSKIIPGWCLSELDAETLAAYDAPFPTQEYAVGARRFPLLAPATADDPERLECDRAWAVLEQWDGPLLTIWGDHCPHTIHSMGKNYRDRVPGARLASVHHTVHQASHFIQEDCGPQVAADIVEFIGQNPLAGA